MSHRELVPSKLRIVRRIGAGGMGVVYEAIHLGLDRRAAVKVIHPQSSESSEAVPGSFAKRAHSRCCSPSTSCKCST
jgi:serine/threonine-protein kinase